MLTRLHSLYAIIETIIILGGLMISKKLQNITPSYTIGISTKVNEMKQAGRNILNLSIGEPDFTTPECAKQGGIHAIEENLTKYDGAAGLQKLKIAICEKLKRENNLGVSPEEIVISSGAKHAITNTLLVILNPEEEVLIPKPYWVSYPEMVKLTGGVPVFIDTQEVNQYKVTVDDIKRFRSPNTKAIILCNPSNPSGAVYTKAELTDLAHYCVETNLIIIADEIYERICYTENFTSIASLSEAVRAITITINGLSKSAAMTGWRIGYTVAPPAISKAIASVQGHLVSHPATPSQWAGVRFFESGDADLAKMVEAYKMRRDFCVDKLSKIPGLKMVQPDGAFYIFMDLSVLKPHLTYEGSFSLKVTEDLLVAHEVAVVPGIAFGMDDFIRISYATDLSIVEEAIKRLETYMSGIMAQ